MTTELWTPAGTVHVGAAPVGRNVETGGKIVAHRFMLTAKDKFGKEHKTRVQILADDTTSKAHLEEMMGNCAEKFMQEVREKYDKRPPTPEEHKEIGRALNEFNKHMKLRRESTTGKIYF
jgi:hypothetical protein